MATAENFIPHVTFASAVRWEVNKVEEEDRRVIGTLSWQR